MKTTGILLLNVGTPNALNKEAVRTYLAEFLSDPYVVDYPRWLWMPLLYGIILRVRPGRSLQRYRKIWTKSGSPMLVYMGEIAERLQERYRVAGDHQISFQVAMRYGKPSIVEALERLREQNPDRILSFPLFPQYSATTTGTSERAVAAAIRTTIPDITHQLIPEYHAHPAYIHALEQHIRGFWEGAEKPQQVLFSFHGIPARFEAKGDPYAQQCARTAELLAAALNLETSGWRMGYQSRFGPEPWLRPYTGEILVELGKQGVRSLHVVAPGFSVDCLETLEEIEEEGGDLFRQAGGVDFRYIPALNAGGFHIEALSAILDEWIALI